MKKELITYRNPKSPVAEVFRTLRTNIQFMNTKRNLKTVLITSTMPGEGKSWVAANLATTFAQADKKVLIIDADMRKGRQHRIFSLENKPGLSNYLLEGNEDVNVDVLRYVKPTDVENLYLMTNGDIPPNPSELLASNATINLIEKVKEIFDVIIFDGPPSLLVTDASIIARLVDTTIIVTEYNKTKKDNLVKVKKSLESVGASIAGTIINKNPVNPKKYKDSYYYRSSTNSTSNANQSIRNKRKTTNNEEKIMRQLDEYYENKKK